MMGDSQRALLLRRQRLLERSQALRSRVAQEAPHWRGPLAATDQVLQLGRWIHAHRGWLIGAAALTLVVRPRRAWRWLGRGWWLWRLSRRLQPWIGAARGLLGSAPPTARR